MAALLAAGAAGCSVIPGAGPLRGEIDNQSTSNTNSPNPFVLVDIDDHVVKTLTSRSDPSLRGAFGDYRGPSVYTIGVGDTLHVTIYEAGSGGLFSAPAVNGVATGSRASTIPEQTVGQDGAISIPYAGRIQVVGRTAEAVERVIVEQLLGKAIQPQAVVSVARSVRNSATVIGEVVSGARVPLSPRGDRILDVVAAAGGVRSPIHETFIGLTRGGRTVMVPMQVVTLRPNENVYVRPQDTLSVIRQPQTFTAFGATGRNAVVPFDAVGITLEEAVARAGGLIDQRSDPQGVYLMRFEDADLVRKMVPSETNIPPGKGVVRTIYRFDMRSASAIFLGRQFRIRNKDAIYVANAPLADLQKILNVFSTVAQPVITVSRVANGFD